MSNLQRLDLFILAHKTADAQFILYIYFRPIKHNRSVFLIHNPIGQTMFGAVTGDVLPMTTSHPVTVGEHLVRPVEVKKLNRAQ